MPPGTWRPDPATLVIAILRSGACPQTLPLGVDWDSVLRLATRHRVGPLLWQALATAPSGMVPEHVRSHLQALAGQSTAMKLRHESALRTLLARLTADGIATVVLKGPALAHALYAPPALRPYHDLDLLCRPADHLRIRRSLTALGYTAPPLNSWRRLSDLRLRPNEQSFTNATMQIQVEVHFDLFQFGLVERHLDEAWCAAAEQRFGPLTMRVLAPEHQLLHVAAHAHRHRYAQLLWLNDLDLLVRRWRYVIDWNRVVGTARDEGIGAVLRHALDTAHVILGTPLPPLPAPTPEERMLGALYRLLWPRNALFRLASREHWRLLRFQPDTGDLRDVLAGIVLLGRRREKWRVRRDTISMARPTVR
jgi:hypothetical protein